MTESELTPSQSPEALKPEVMDVAIIFGEGPVKPVVFYDELAPELQEQWKAFTKLEKKTDAEGNTFVEGPRHRNEPNFYVVDRNFQVKDAGEEGHLTAFGRDLARIDENATLSAEDKKAEKEKLRHEWQHNSRFALKRMGRMNAMGAGDALLSGTVEEIILSGGPTVPKNFFEAQFDFEDPTRKDLSPDERKTQLDAYVTDKMEGMPSEGSLMRDLVIKHFGRDYKAKYGKDIEEVLKTEEEATNTFRNLTLSIEKFPEVTDKTKKIAILTADHHVERASFMTDRFGIVVNENGRLSSQNNLINRAAARNKQAAIELYTHFKPGMGNPDVTQMAKDQERWIYGLTTPDPEIVNYWAPHIFELRQAEAIERIFTAFNDPEWQDAFRGAFAKAGLSYDTLQETDLVQLQTTDSDKFEALRGDFLRLFEYRPEAIKEIQNRMP